MTGRVDWRTAPVVIAPSLGQKPHRAGVELDSSHNRSADTTASNPRSRLGDSQTTPNEYTGQLGEIAMGLRSGRDIPSYHPSSQQRSSVHSSSAESGLSPGTPRPLPSDDGATSSELSRQFPKSKERNEFNHTPQSSGLSASDIPPTPPASQHGTSAADLTIAGLQGSHGIDDRGDKKKRRKDEGGLEDESAFSLHRRIKGCPNWKLGCKFESDPESVESHIRRGRCMFEILKPYMRRKDAEIAGLQEEVTVLRERVSELTKMIEVLIHVSSPRIQPTLASHSYSLLPHLDINAGRHGSSGFVRDTGIPLPAFDPTRSVDTSKTTRAIDLSLRKLSAPVRSFAIDRRKSQIDSIDKHTEDIAGDLSLIWKYAVSDDYDAQSDSVDGSSSSAAKGSDVRHSGSLRRTVRFEESSDADSDGTGNLLSVDHSSSSSGEGGPSAWPHSGAPSVLSSLPKNRRKGGLSSSSLKKNSEDHSMIGSINASDLFLDFVVLGASFENRHNPHSPSMRGGIQLWQVQFGESSSKEDSRHVSEDATQTSSASVSSVPKKHVSSVSSSSAPSSSSNSRRNRLPKIVGMILAGMKSASSHSHGIEMDLGNPMTIETPGNEACFSLNSMIIPLNTTLDTSSSKSVVLPLLLTGHLSKIHVWDYATLKKRTKFNQSIHSTNTKPVLTIVMDEKLRLFQSSDMLRNRRNGGRTSRRSSSRIVGMDGLLPPSSVTRGISLTEEPNSIVDEDEDEVDDDEEERRAIDAMFQEPPVDLSPTLTIEEEDDSDGSSLQSGSRYAFAKKMDSQSTTTTTTKKSKKNRDSLALSHRRYYGYNGSEMIHPPFQESYVRSLDTAISVSDILHSPVTNIASVGSLLFAVNGSNEIWTYHLTCMNESPPDRSASSHSSRTDSAGSYTPATVVRAFLLGKLHSAHRAPVTVMKSFGNLLISACQAGTLCVFNVRGNALNKRGGVREIGAIVQLIGTIDSGSERESICDLSVLPNPFPRYNCEVFRDMLFAKPRRSSQSATATAAAAASSATAAAASGVNGSSSSSIPKGGGMDPISADITVPAVRKDGSRKRKRRKRKRKKRDNQDAKSSTSEDSGIQVEIVGDGSLLDEMTDSNQDRDWVTPAMIGLSDGRLSDLTDDDDDSDGLKEMEIAMNLASLDRATSTGSAGDLTVANRSSGSLSNPFFPLSFLTDPSEHGADSTFSKKKSGLASSSLSSSAAGGLVVSGKKRSMIDRSGPSSELQIVLGCRNGEIQFWSSNNESSTDDEMRKGQSSSSRKRRGGVPSLSKWSLQRRMRVSAEPVTRLSCFGEDRIIVGYSNGNVKLWDSSHRCLGTVFGNPTLRPHSVIVPDIDDDHSRHESGHKLVSVNSLLLLPSEQSFVVLSGFSDGSLTIHSVV